MAAPTNTVLTTSVAGNREDLSDIISMIAPTATPFISTIGRSKATNTLHEWQTDDLAAAANNTAVEGDDAAAAALIPTVRLNNNTQISTKTVIVSGSQQAANPAGRSNELAYQMTKKSKEIKRDMEFALLQNGVKASAPRQTRGVVGWMGDNVDAGSGYVAPNYTTNVAQTDGTQAAFTEARLKNVLQKCFTAGGDPNMIFMGPAAKQTFSTFTGNSTRFDKGEDKQVTASVDVYVSDFGELKAVPSRFQRARDVFVLQSDKWALAMYRPFQTNELAKTGDAEKRQIVVEYALECRNPKASGGVLDVL